MDTSTLSQKGLPKELASIPAGQIFILTNPHLGITSDNITHIQGIFSIAKSVNKRKDVIVNALPGEWSELMGCYVCKVGQEVLLADNDTLVEMLCEFWGLDYDEVCKTLKIAGRNSDGRKAITFGGDTHPMRVAVPAKKPDDTKEEPDFGISLGYIHTHTREGVLGDIRSTLKENFSYGLGVPLEQIIAIYNEELMNCKSYTLDIQIEWKEVIKVVKPVKVMKSCEISLVDNAGTSYPIKLRAECKAIYLTFIMIEEGVYYSEVGEDKFFDIYKQIYSKMPRAIGTPKRYDLLDDDQLDIFTNYTSQIRRAIKAATNDPFCVEQFAVEGYKKDMYRVAGATDENRDFIRKEFGIK